MPEHKNVHEAKLAVMKEVPYIQKTSGPGLNYTFAGEADLIEKLHSSMVKNGLEITPVEASIVSEKEKTSKQGSVGHIVRLLVSFRLVHGPSLTCIDVQTIGEAMDYGDKACAKAMTIALKYALRQSFLIQTGDDPDYHHQFRDAENEDWCIKAVAKMNACKTPEELAAQFEKFRGTDPTTKKPLFTAEQLGELAARRENRLGQIQEGK